MKSRAVVLKSCIIFVFSSIYEGKYEKKNKFCGANVQIEKLDRWKDIEIDGKDVVVNNN